MRSELLASLLSREEQGPIPRSWQYSLSKRGHEGLALNATKLVKRVHKEAVTWLDLDRVEHRYLLSGSADASVAIFDTQGQPQVPPEDSELGAANGAGGAARQDAAHQQEPELQPLLFLDRSSSRDAHRFLVSCVCWYPIDTGLFVTGSYDTTIKVWDTNCQELVCSFPFSASVSAAAMSQVATTHCLIAAACQNQYIRLCDPGSGAFTQTILGHREAVWTVSWSLRSEFELVSGDRSGQVRVWDIRRAGCLRVLDQYATTAAATAPPPPDDAPPAPKRRRGPTAGSATLGGGPGPPPDPRQGLSAVVGAAEAHQKAHHGHVTCVLPTPDGLHWVSAGTDARVRLWDAFSWHNTLVSYPDTRNKSGRAKLLAVSADGRALFHPCDNDVQVFDLRSGQLLHQLRQGHYGAVNACVYGAPMQELYTGGEDGQMLVWSYVP